MPPKRGGRRGNTSNEQPAEQAPPVAPSSEDAKPNVDHLNAASSEAERPSDPAASQSQLDPVSVNTTPAPSARSTPSVQQTETPTQPTPSSASRGKRPLTAPRGAGRRSQAKREELQKVEDERRRQEAQERAQEDAAKAKQQGRARWHGGGRGRGRGEFRGARGKGRGGYVGDAETRDKEAVASGPFSAGEITKAKRGGGKWRTSGGISRGSQKGFSARRSSELAAEAEPGESGSFTTGLAPPKRSANPSHSTGGGSRSKTADDGTHVKPDPDKKPALDADGDILMSGRIDGGIISSDEESDEKERRFNIENLIDLTGDDDDYDPMAPVRVTRVAHKERTMGLNADGATTKEGAIAVGANDAATTAKRKGKQSARDVPETLELSSGSDKEGDQAAEPTVKPDPEASSAAEERLQEPQLAGGASNLDDLPQEPSSSPEIKRKGKEKTKARTLSSSLQPDRPDLQTQEEMDEWDRNQTDLRILRNELGTPAAIAAGGEMAGEDKRADKVYLFQFPPVLPDLAPLAIKTDPDGPPGDAMQVDGPSSTKENPIDVSDTASNQPKLPSGMVGKLNIHRSGRATLDWGGTSFCLGMGAEASFLQDIFVAQVPDQKDGDSAMGGAGDEGVAMSMGQVKGKFVVTPDWDEILG